MENKEYESGLVFSELNSIKYNSYSETIEDYKGFKIDILRILKDKYVTDGVYILINGINTHGLNARTSIRHAEAIAKYYIEDVLIPNLENVRFDGENAEKEK